jgi:hypothetical protein
MTADVLEPRIELLSKEYVLVQAWKKTASHLRYHNWFSDTLELDQATINLPRFLAELAEQLEAPSQWNNNPLRIVPAPKSQQWHVNSNGLWRPVESEAAVKIRPLAHVSLKDQVAATAVMLCLADLVETAQGDPRAPVSDAAARKKVISYGNRLFCHGSDGKLYHHWGSAKLYRAYFVDYRNFLLRPQAVASGVKTEGDSQVVIVHLDLLQFYDRVKPVLLGRKLDAIKKPGHDPSFYEFARRLLNWEWDKKDSREVERYTEQTELSDFAAVTLPQGLVSAGFFANMVLLDFDQSLREALSREIEPGVILEDACRYVDDLRIVLTVPREKKLPEIEFMATKWLAELLDRHAEGLEPKKDKTQAAEFKGDARPLVRQSRKMARIQGAISGGFDAIGGEEILDAIQGLMRAQQRYSEQSTEGPRWPFSPIPDVRDETVARFAAGRFRSTYRSLRPLLESCQDTSSIGEQGSNENDAGRSRVPRTQAELDDEARTFALGLIGDWVEDPSNVRLLRIGLDLWPAEDVLEKVLGLLRPFTAQGGLRDACHRIAWYCLSEVFRAGSTETGFVEDSESLPAELNISVYRALLQEEANRLVLLPPADLPWYLRQQVLLFIATSDKTKVPISQMGRDPETESYRKLIGFLRGERVRRTGADFATLAILARRSFRGQEIAGQLASSGINARQLEEIGKRDPSLAIEILAARPALSEAISPRLRDDLCLRPHSSSEGWMTLTEAVLHAGPSGLLRNEPAILCFASKFLMEGPKLRNAEVITPSDVLLKRSTAGGEFDEVRIVPSRVAPLGSMYQPPPWCPASEHWRFQLGYLLRFILTAQEDFTKAVRHPHWKNDTMAYRTPDSHWYQRLYGLFNGHSAFGDDWLPISNRVEQLLFSLLSWPGCRISETTAERDIDKARADIEGHRLGWKQGSASSVLMLPLLALRPDKHSTLRPLRACVVQTVIPSPEDFDSSDLTFSNQAIRKRHRNHLSSALAAVERMLDLRETHRGREGRLDWLLLPELAVHPRDIRTHLVPFARAYKTIILAGVTYEELLADQPLVNSAIWVIPQWSSEHGLQIMTRRQGKQHLAPDEEGLNSSTNRVVQGFRPCQWLVGYNWSSCAEDALLWLTASICYDATDISLTADLSSVSDVFAIPALNKDVHTFDQMALALHYHMYQYVVVANNGHYGGSNAYAPFREAYRRQIFHLHGQPQASMAFFEIDDIPGVLNRRKSAPDSWKARPAGI